MFRPLQLVINGIVKQMDLIDIYTFYPNTKEYILLSVPHGTFFKIDNIFVNTERMNR